MHEAKSSFKGCPQARMGLSRPSVTLLQDKEQFAQCGRSLTWKSLTQCCAVCCEPHLLQSLSTSNSPVAKGLLVSKEKTCLGSKQRKDGS